MTDEMMTLRSMLEKGTDADVLREMIGFAAQRLMEMEVQAVTGAGHGERCPERQVQRNGYRGKRLAKAGQKLGITAKPVARGRDGKFLPTGICWAVERSFSWIANYRRLNTFFKRTREYLVAFIEIAFVSILYRRIKRFVSEEASASFLQTASDGGTHMLLTRRLLTTASDIARQSRSVGPLSSRSSIRDSTERHASSANEFSSDEGSEGRRN